MNEPEIVPGKVSNPINKYIIIAILTVGVGIFVVMNVTSEDDAGMMAFILSVSFATVVAILSFIVAIQNREGGLAKAYLSLGFGYTAYTIAEVLYYSLDYFGFETYPSIADVFFFALYPLTLGHLLLNKQYFQTEFTKAQKVWIPGIPILAIIVYIIMFTGVPDSELNFDFYYGLIFVAGAATILPFTIIGAVTFREGMLGVVWMLLVFGLMISTAGDVWYYHLEIFGAYYDAHPVTVVWFVSNMFMIYALYKHIKIF